MAEASSSSVRTLLRTINRGLRKESLNPRSQAVRRTEPLPRYIQALVRETDSSLSSATLSKRLENLNLLITNARIHEELLARYNPVYGKSSSERIRATAQRVGWDVPIEYQDAVKQKLEAESKGIDEKYRS